MRFELSRLSKYDEASLLGEMRRVADLVPGQELTSSEFSKLSKVSASTLRKRYGGWRNALAAAGLEHRFDETNEAYTREEIVALIQRTARDLGTATLPKKALAKHTGLSDRPIRRLFGSYRAALEAAGLQETPGGRRHTDEACYENLLSVWVAHGRQPHFAEMKESPSSVGPKAYVVRWGSWRAALAAFVERVNRDTASIPRAVAAPPKELRAPGRVKRTPREVPLGLRYAVLKRDRFRCVIDGRSPATHQVSLHVDHILAWSLGGETVPENLRTLCSECNLGKGASREDG